MSAEEFYLEFKDALDYLGPGFTGKDRVEIRIENDKLYLSANGRECIIRVEPAK